MTDNDTPPDPPAEPLPLPLAAAVGYLAGEAAKADAATAAAIARAVNDAIELARKHRAEMGAVNWADLRCCAVHRVEPCYFDKEDGSASPDRQFWQIWIEEAAPDCDLPEFVAKQLAERFGHGLEVRCQW